MSSLRSGGFTSGRRLHSPKADGKVFFLRPETFKFFFFSRPPNHVFQVKLIKTTRFIAEKVAEAHRNKHTRLRTTHFSFFLMTKATRHQNNNKNKLFDLGTTSFSQSTISTECEALNIAFSAFGISALGCSSQKPEKHCLCFSLGGNSGFKRMRQ